jgi:hypothetical protein
VTDQTNLKEKLWAWHSVIFMSLLMIVLFVPGYLALKAPEGFRLVSHLWRDLFLFVGALILSGILLYCGGFKAHRLASRSLLFVLFACLTLFEIFSGFQSAQPHFALMSLVRNLALFVWTVSALLFWQSSHSKRHVYLLVGVMLLTALIGFFYELISFMSEKELSYFVFDELKEGCFQAGFGFPFFNGNLLGAFLMPLALALFAARSFRWMRVPWHFLLLVCLGVLGSSSKAAILILCLMVFMLWLYKVIGFKRIVYFAVGLSIATFVLVPLKMKSAAMTYDNTLGMRRLMWQGVIRGLNDENPPQLLVQTPEARDIDSAYRRPRWKRLFMGWGPGTYVANSSALRQRDYYAHIHSIAVDMHPHSSLFMFLFETGFAGLLLGFFLFSAVFMIFLRHTRLSDEEGSKAKVLMALMLGLVLHSLVSVAPHYYEHRLLWVLVFGAAAAMELKTKNHRYENQKAWPEEFYGPAIAIVLLVSLALFCRVSWVSTERLLGMYAVGGVGQTSSLSQRDELDEALSKLESTLFGRTRWLDGHSLQLMNICRSRRDRFFFTKVLEQSEQIWALAPHYANCSFDLGSYLWMRYKDKGIKHGKDWQRAIQLFKHHIRKGEAQAEIFRLTDSDQELYGSLKEVLRKEHPIHTELFASRVRDKNMRFFLRFYWLRYYSKDKRYRDIILRTIQNLIPQLPEEKTSRYQLCHILSLHCIDWGMEKRNAPLPWLIWSLLKEGGPSPRFMVKKGSQSAYVNCLRVLVFEGEKAADRAYKVLEKEGKYPLLLLKIRGLMNNYIEQKRQIDKKK